jgi:hypothetical protein
VAVDEAREIDGVEAVDAEQEDVLHPSAAAVRVAVVVVVVARLALRSPRRGGQRRRDGDVGCRLEGGRRRSVRAARGDEGERER